MAVPVRFALAVPEDPENLLAMDELRAAIVDADGIDLSMIFVPSYASLYEVVESRQAELVWAPPLVARDLALAGAARPLVAPVRFEEATYYAALVVLPDSPIAHLRDLAGSRIGWVSKLSAAGYVAPRALLRANGLEPRGLFARETVHGSHEAVAEALENRTIDVAATFATFRGGAHFPGPSVPTRILGTTGPIPSDVIVAASHLADETASAIAGAFARVRPRPVGALRDLMKVDRFTVVGADHLAPLGAWTKED